MSQEVSNSGIHPDHLRFSETVTAIQEATTPLERERAYAQMRELYYYSDSAPARFGVITVSHKIPGTRQIVEDALRTDSDSIVRHEAAFRLSETHDPKVVPLLIQTLKTDISPIVRHEAAMALGSIGDIRGISPLLRQLAYETHSKNQEVIQSCIIAISELHSKN